MRRHASRTVLSLGVLLLAGCEDSPEVIELVSGNGQSAAAGETLAQPLVVKVATAAGTGVKSVSVSWAVTAGAGALSQTSGLTDALGQTSVTWTLGTVAGAENTATASVEGLARSPVNFTATATPASLPRWNASPETTKLARWEKSSPSR